MKIFEVCVCIVLQFCVINCKVLPNYLPPLCSQTVANYNQCMVKTLSKWGPYMVKGIREINFPKLNPLVMPILTINRTLNEAVSISAVCKNMQMWGLENSYLKKFDFDPENKKGEVHLFIPFIRSTVEYDVKGRLFSIDLGNVGIMKANVTEIPVFFKFSLKPIERLGIKYYNLDDFDVKGTIGKVHINMASENPDDQFSTDLISNFVNEDPRRSLDAINPLYEESLKVFYETFINQVLSAIPANELLPEEDSS